MVAPLIRLIAFASLAVDIIEDDVVVTKDGPRVLTAAVVKTVEEIEALMAVH